MCVVTLLQNTLKIQIFPTAHIYIPSGLCLYYPWIWHFSFPNIYLVYFISYSKKLVISHPTNPSKTKQSKLYFITIYIQCYSCCHLLPKSTSPLWISSFTQYRILPCLLDMHPVISRHWVEFTEKPEAHNHPQLRIRTARPDSAFLLLLRICRKAHFSQNPNHTGLDQCRFPSFAFSDHRCRTTVSARRVTPPCQEKNSPPRPFTSTDPKQSPILSCPLSHSWVCGSIYIPVTKFRSMSKITFECLLLSLYLTLKYIIYFLKPPLLNTKYFQLKTHLFTVLEYTYPKS